MPESYIHSVLVVDDQESERLQLAQQLESAGYQVTTASNGAKARAHLQANWAPMIIINWEMPQMEGPELCRTIRADEGMGFAYIIAISGNRTGEDDLVKAFEAGADDFLRKPYKVNELLARVGAGKRIIRLHQDLQTRTREVSRYNAESEIVNRKLADANEKLKTIAITDELTGLWNRREAMARCLEAWAAAERHGHSLAFMSLDIDHFKRCNDTYGHAAGDAVLKQTAAVLTKHARRDEAVCRLGGEEFLIICLGSDEAQAAVGANRLRRAVEANAIDCGERQLRVTISVGVADRNFDMKGPDDLLKAADAALYAAKKAGRNRVCQARQVATQNAPAKETQTVGR